MCYHAVEATQKSTHASKIHLIIWNHTWEMDCQSLKCPHWNRWTLNRWQWKMMLELYVSRHYSLISLLRDRQTSRLRKSVVMLRFVSIEQFLFRNKINYNFKIQETKNRHETDRASSRITWKIRSFRQCFIVTGSIERWILGGIQYVGLKFVSRIKSNKNLIFSLQLI